MRRPHQGSGLVPLAIESAIFRARAAVSYSLKAITGPGAASDPKGLRRAIIRGTASLSSSSRLPLNSRVSVESPVILPPGRAKLSTSPAATGSIGLAMTMGIVLVACLAASIAKVDVATRTSTLSCTSSVTRPGIRSSFPSAGSDTQTGCFFPQYNRDRAALAGMPQPEAGSLMPDSRHISDPWDFRWLLRLGGEASRQEHSDQSRTKIFLLIVLALTLSLSKTATE